MKWQIKGVEVGKALNGGFREQGESCIKRTIMMRTTQHRVQDK